jgi:hypothetical protein
MCDAFAISQGLDTSTSEPTSTSSCRAEYESSTPPAATESETRPSCPGPSQASSHAALRVPLHERHGSQVAAEREPETQPRSLDDARYQVLDLASGGAGSLAVRANQRAELSGS